MLRICWPAVSFPSRHLLCGVNLNSWWLVFAGGTMYGLLLENMAEYIKQVYGEDKWEEIRRQAAVEQPSFSVHQVYPENLIPRLAKKAIQVSWQSSVVQQVDIKMMYLMHLPVSDLEVCEETTVTVVWSHSEYRCCCGLNQSPWSWT